MCDCGPWREEEGEGKADHHAATEELLDVSPLKVALLVVVVVP